MVDDLILRARSCPAIFISAPSSNQGKTTVAAALAFMHRREGRNVRVFKAGPDFLDPMILECASGNRVYQLDLWMMGENECRRLLYEAAGTADIIIVEGVMGLFDGSPSSADLADLFKIPIAAVIDASSMAQTFGAVVFGLTNFRQQVKFAGVLANRVGSARHTEMLLEAMPSAVPFLGSLSRNSEYVLPARHLGLIQADEVIDLNSRIAATADALLPTQLATLPAPVTFAAPETVPSSTGLNGLTIGIAKDSAFSFLYPANLDFLQEQGASLSFFSPLTDNQIPDCDCLYFPGGYPELYIKELAANASIKERIRTHFNRGKSIYAECGGMLYTLEALTNTEGVTGQMLGLLAGKAVMQRRFKGLGYEALNIGAEEIRGHTFHYSNCSIDASPIAHAERFKDGQVGEPLYKIQNLVASYIHLYFASNPELATKLILGLQLVSRLIEIS